MKKIISLLACLALAASLVAAVPASAAETDSETGLQFEFDGSKVTITGMSEPITGEFVVPETINGYPVKAIAPGAFSGGEFTSVVIPGSFTEIPDNLFTNCKELTSVTIGEGVVSIGMGAFRDCEKLASVTIGESVTRIREGAFYMSGLALGEAADDDGALYIGDVLIECDNSELKEYSIKPGTRLIADSAFYNCRMLETVTIPESVAYIGRRAFERTKAFMDAAAEPGDIYIGDILIEAAPVEGTAHELRAGTRVIADEAFRDCAVSALSGTESLEYIGNSAFICRGIEALNLGVKGIGIEAFRDCTALSSVVLSGTKYIAPNAFYGCTALTGITASGNGLNIGASAFSGCTALTGAELSGTDAIGKMAFSGCAELKEVSIADGVKFIGAEAFADCSALKTLPISENTAYIGNEAFAYCTAASGEVTVPESVTYLGDGAFWGCSAITSAVINANITSIGSMTFRECPALSSVVLPGTLTEIDSITFMDTALYKDEKNREDGAFYIGDILIEYDDPESTGYVIKDGTRVIASFAFAVGDGFGFESVTIPKGVTHIGEGAFSGATDLKELKLPEGIKSIGNGAFEHCRSLNSVTIPESTEFIGEGAFSNCLTLTEVNIPGSVETIKSKTFGGCDALRSVTIGDGVKTIEDGAFFSCPDLESISVPKSVEYIGSAFEDCDYMMEMTLPFVGKSRTAEEPDSRFSAIFGGKEPTRLEKVTITDTERIPDFAFDGGEYKLLHEINLPDGLLTIGECAFGRLDIWEITIPETVTSIGDGAFLNCKSLEKVTLYNKVKSIGASAFFGCNSLESVTYNGTEADWAKINIGSDNECLKEAKFNFIAPVIPGDVTGDGVVTRSDLLRLAKYFSGFEVEIDSAAADVTGDGEVTRSDLLRLAKYFSGFDVKLGQ